MTHFSSRKTAVSFIILLCLAALSASAETRTILNPIGADDVKTVIVRIADFLVMIAAPLTTLIVLYAAFLYLTGGGNQDQIKRAHKALIWAIVGFVVILLAKGLAELIQNVIAKPGS